MATTFTLSISTAPSSSSTAAPAAPTPTVRPTDAGSRLNEAERLITEAVTNAAAIVQELSKEKAVLRNVEQLVGDFAGNISKAEQALLEQIAYLQRFQGGHVFESSAYGAIKDAEIAEERLRLIAELVCKLPIQSEESTTVMKPDRQSAQQEPEQQQQPTAMEVSTSSPGVVPSSAGATAPFSSLFQSSGDANQSTASDQQ